MPPLLFFLPHLLLMRLRGGSLLRVHPCQPSSCTSSPAFCVFFLFFAPKPFLFILRCYTSAFFPGLSAAMSRKMWPNFDMRQRLLLVASSHGAKIFVSRARGKYSENQLFAEPVSERATPSRLFRPFSGDSSSRGETLLCATILKWVSLTVLDTPKVFQSTEPFWRLIDGEKSVHTAKHAGSPMVEMCSMCHLLATDKHQISPETRLYYQRPSTLFMVSHGLLPLGKKKINKSGLPI